MAYLVVANLILTAAIIAVACFLALKARRKRKLSRPAWPQGAAGVASERGDYAVRSDWKRKPGKLNYSSFVYLDVDRDGRYSLPDRPMSAVVVHLSGPRGPVHTASTNGNGFANFTMSTTLRKGHVRLPGTYRFIVSVPPGWICTSMNDIQEMTFDLIEGSPAGIGAASMVQPVGIAPVRTVKGYVPGGATVTLRFARNGASIQEIKLRAGIRFDLGVPTEADAIEVVGPDEIGTRTLKLSSYPTDLGTIAPVGVALPEEALQKIDFNEVTAKGLRKIPNGYAGLNWFNLNAIARDFYASSQGYVNGNTSGDHSCYTSSGHPAELWSEEAFGFHSIMLTSAWRGSEGETCVVESWRGEELAARDEVVVSALTPVHYAPLLMGVTRIRFSSRHYWQIVLDDLMIAR